MPCPGGPGHAAQAWSNARPPSGTAAGSPASGLRVASDCCANETATAATIVNAPSAVALRDNCGFLDVVEIGELAREVLVSLLVNQRLLGTLFVAGIQAVDDVHAGHDFGERREPQPVVGAVVGHVDEQLRRPRIRAAARERQGAAYVF